MGKIRHAAGAVELAANNFNFLTVELVEIVQHAKAQGHLYVEIDVTDNPQLERLGIDGVIKLKVKLPGGGA